MHLLKGHWFCQTGLSLRLQGLASGPDTTCGGRWRFWWQGTRQPHGEVATCTPATPFSSALTPALVPARLAACTLGPLPNATPFFPGKACIHQAAGLFPEGRTAPFFTPSLQPLSIREARECESLYCLPFETQRTQLFKSFLQVGGKPSSSGIFLQLSLLHCCHVSQLDAVTVVPAMLGACSKQASLQEQVQDLCISLARW